MTRSSGDTGYLFPIATTTQPRYTPQASAWVLKSIHAKLDFPPLTLDHILLFPLLKVLRVNFHTMGIDNGDGSDGSPTVIQPSNPPMLTGSLNLAITGLKHFIRQLSSLPTGIHFRNITVTWTDEGDILPTAALVE